VEPEERSWMWLEQQYIHNLSSTFPKPMEPEVDENKMPSIFPYLKKLEVRYVLVRDPVERSSGASIVVSLVVGEGRISSTSSNGQIALL
jgi:hypothetical protein